MVKFAVLTSIAVLCVSTGTALSEPIGRACMKSERAKSNTRLCKCIQSAADATLTRRDQERAAKLFLNPEQSQNLKMSNRRGDEKFWERYQEFGELAKAFCS